MPNSARFDYQYQPAQGLPPVPATANTNTVVTQINTVIAAATKAVDLAFAKLGDTITYTVSATNSGNVPMVDVSFVDPIPAGLTFVSGSVTVNGTAMPLADPAAGFALPNVAPGATTQIIFRTTAQSAPVSNTFVNRASIGYDYRVDPAGPAVPTKTIETNDVTTTLNDAHLSLTKAADRAYADLGDTVSYTFNLTYQGTVPAQNTVFTDPLPACLSFVPGSLTLNGVPISGDIQTGVPLGSVTQSATLAFQATVSCVPDANPLANTGAIRYSFTVDPSQPPVTVTTPSNTVELVVSHAEATITKAVDTSYATCGDALHYGLVVTNSGNAAAKNLTLDDPQPAGTQFVPGSLTINGQAVPSPGWPFPYLLGNVAPGQTIFIGFQVTVACS